MQLYAAWPFMAVVVLHWSLASTIKATETPSNATAVDWYVEDHPFMYVMEKVRAPNGTWVPNPNFSLPPLTMDEFFGNVSTRLPWFVQLYANINTKKLRQAQTDARKTYWYNFVSPMDWGRSARAEFNRREYRQAMAHFWFDMVGKSVLTRAAQNVYELVVGGWQRQIEEAAFYKNFVKMSLEEFAVTVNMTKEDLTTIKEIAAERMRKNWTMPYEFKAPILFRAWPSEKKQVSEFFQPYTNYTSRYYTSQPQHDLPPPSLPAATTYPWPWHERISQARAALLQLIQVATVNNVVMSNSTLTNGSGTGDIKHRRSLPAEPQCVEFGTEAGDGKCEEVLLLMSELINEFHFSTGIPRMRLISSHFMPLVFPTDKQLFNASIGTNSSQSSFIGDFVNADSEAGIPHSRKNGNLIYDIDYAGREGVYAAAKQFYSYDTVEKDFVLLKDIFNLTEAIRGDSAVVSVTPPPQRFANCSLSTPCTARSGVTIFTPSLATAVYEIFQLTKPGSRGIEASKRLGWLERMVRDAFDAEKRALETGLVAPSTVWYSYYDVDADMLGDEVLGLANATKAQLLAAGELTPSKMYEVLTAGPKSPLQLGSGYYVSTNSKTQRAIQLKGSIPAVAEFRDEDLIELIEYLFEQMRDVEAAVERYVHKRDVDPVHIAMVNATEAEVLYDGRLYGLLGFGYLLPATNKLNVAYLDHKLPVPFHLVMRLLIRLQESHLVLPEESRRILGCLAMLRFDVKYYKCVRSSTVGKPSSSTPIQVLSPLPPTPREPILPEEALEW